MATTDTTFKGLEEWRQSCFEELGFSAYDAARLAQVVVTSWVRTRTGMKRYESPLHHHRVRMMLDAGATMAQVIDIYL